MGICIVGTNQTEITLTLHMQNVSWEWRWSRTILLQNLETSTRNCQVKVILNHIKVSIVEPTLAKSYFCSDHACSRCYSEERYRSILAPEKSGIYQQFLEKSSSFTRRDSFLITFFPFLSNLPISSFYFPLWLAFWSVLQKFFFFILAIRVP